MLDIAEVRARLARRVCLETFVRKISVRVRTCPAHRVDCVHPVAPIVVHDVEVVIVVVVVVVVEAVVVRVAVGCGGCSGHSICSQGPPH